MSYLFYFDKFVINLHENDSSITRHSATYKFSLKLASLLPSQKSLSILEEIKDNFEELDEFSRHLFEIVINKDININSIFEIKRNNPQLTLDAALFKWTGLDLGLCSDDEDFCPGYPACCELPKDL